MTPIVEATGLCKRYPLPQGKGQFNAVDGVSLRIATGEVFALLGPNGAGKTTTLEMLEGLTDIDAGQARIAGHDVAREPYVVKRLIGVQLQANDFFEHLNLQELLRLFAALYDSKADPLALLDQVNLREKAKARPAQLSGGQKQRFSIACALVNSPRVLFLDEPTTGLDPQAKRKLWTLVESLNAGGMTIVLTTHNMEEAEYLCDRLAIMDNGRIIADGSPQSLIERFAPTPGRAPTQGNLEDVFLHLTGHDLRE